MTESVANLEKRQNRLEDAIEKLTDISGDLNKMLAVQNQRLNQQEKEVDIINSMLDKHREDLNDKLENVYEKIENKEKNIFNEITEQYKKLNDRITQLERYIWMAIGGGIAVTWAVATLTKYIK